MSEGKGAGESVDIAELEELIQGWREYSGFPQREVGLTQAADELQDLINGWDECNG